MIAYNLYYNNKLINNAPIDGEELSKIMDKKKITKTRQIQVASA